MMSQKTLAMMALLTAWLGACYGLRFGLMENQHWVNVCDPSATLLACEARRLMGLVIHFRLLAWTALALAAAAALLKHAAGTRAAWAALFIGMPALVLYTATPASFALLIAALRLTRSPPAI